LSQALKPTPAGRRFRVKKKDEVFYICGKGFIKIYATQYVFSAHRKCGSKQLAQPTSQQNETAVPHVSDQ
jgi:hypothetical protein